jgi:uncharacterized membrane protein
MPFSNLVSISSVLLVGLAAGLLYGYDCSVIKGLNRLPDREYISCFQSINTAILNPYFFISFMGSLIMLPLAAWLGYKHETNSAFYLMLASALMYAVGVFGVTVIGNVPLNNSIDAFNLSTATAEDMKAMRQSFEMKWNWFHHIRTYAAILSFLLATISLSIKS